MNLNDRNQRLEKALERNPIDKQISILAEGGEKRNRQIRLLAVSLVLEAFLILGFGWTALQAHSAAVKAETNQSAILHNCETANDSRKNNHALWDYVLALPPQLTPTLEQQQTRTQFKEFVDKTFAPRDCQAEIRNQ